MDSPTTIFYKIRKIMILLITKSPPSFLILLPLILYLVIGLFLSPYNFHETLPPESAGIGIDRFPNENGFSHYILFRHKSPPA